MVAQSLCIYLAIEVPAIPGILFKAATAFALLSGLADALVLPPGHQGLTEPCQTCHTTEGWKPVRSKIQFDHDKTDFTLEAQHRQVDCVACHAKGEFRLSQSTCATCHLDVHQGGNGTDCAQCHDSRSWNPPDALRMHDQTRFPLAGAHAMVDCESCHVNTLAGAFTSLATDCIACHQSDFEAATEPNNVAASFSTDCEACHTEHAFKPATFDHAATSFPLSGAHVTAECSSCHVNGVFTGTPTDCWSCHQTAYEQT